MREHGFQSPFDGRQMAAWVLIPMFGIVFQVLHAPFLPTSLQTPFTIIFWSLAGISIIFNYISSISNGADPGVYHKTNPPKRANSRLGGREKSRAAIRELYKQIQKQKQDEFELQLTIASAPEHPSSDEKELKDLKNPNNEQSKADASIPQNKPKTKDITGLHRFLKKLAFKWRRIVLIIKMKRMIDGLPKHAHVSDEERTYCHLCSAFVHETSKHCRVCDKCIIGFDHHCKWLNNCVGSFNYTPFFIFVSLTLLVAMFQTSVAGYLLADFGANESDFRSRIASKYPGMDAYFCLALISFFEFLETPVVFLLGHLWGFHVFLYFKDVTTYEYILAQRAQLAEAETQKAILEARKRRLKAEETERKEYEEKERKKAAAQSALSAMTAETPARPSLPSASSSSSLPPVPVVSVSKPLKNNDNFFFSMDACTPQRFRSSSLSASSSSAAASTPFAADPSIPATPQSASLQEPPSHHPLGIPSPQPSPAQHKHHSRVESLSAPSSDIQQQNNSDSPKPQKESAKSRLFICLPSRRTGKVEHEVQRIDSSSATGAAAASPSIEVPANRVVFEEDPGTPQVGGLAKLSPSPGPAADHVASSSAGPLAQRRSSFTLSVETPKQSELDPFGDNAAFQRPHQHSQSDSFDLESSFASSSAGHHSRGNSLSMDMDAAAMAFQVAEQEMQRDGEPDDLANTKQFKSKGLRFLYVSRLLGCAVCSVMPQGDPSGKQPISLRRKRNAILRNPSSSAPSTPLASSSGSLVSSSAVAAGLLPHAQSSSSASYSSHEEKARLPPRHPRTASRAPAEDPFSAASSSSSSAPLDIESGGSASSNPISLDRKSPVDSILQDDAPVAERKSSSASEPVSISPVSSARPSISASSQPPQGNALTRMWKSMWCSKTPVSSMKSSPALSPMDQESEPPLGSSSALQPQYSFENRDPLSENEELPHAISSAKLCAVPAPSAAASSSSSDSPSSSSVSMLPPPILSLSRDPHISAPVAVAVEDSEARMLALSKKSAEEDIAPQDLQSASLEQKSTPEKGRRNDSDSSAQQQQHLAVPSASSSALLSSPSASISITSPELVASPSLVLAAAAAVAEGLLSSSFVNHSPVQHSSSDHHISRQASAMSSARSSMSSVAGDVPASQSNLRLFPDLSSLAIDRDQELQIEIGDEDDDGSLSVASTSRLSHSSDWDRLSAASRPSTARSMSDMPSVVASLSSLSSPSQPLQSQSGRSPARHNAVAASSKRPIAGPGSIVSAASASSPNKRSVLSSVHIEPRNPKPSSNRATGSSK